MFTKNETDYYETILAPVADGDGNENNAMASATRELSSSSSFGRTKMRAIRAVTGRPLPKGKYLFVWTLDMKLLVFPDAGLNKHTSPYPGAAPVWHAGEMYIEGEEAAMNGSSEKIGSSSSTRSSHCYVAEMNTESGHYLPTYDHARRFAVWVKKNIAVNSANGLEEARSRVRQAIR